MENTYPVSDQNVNCISDKPKIYSKQAILGFSIFFSAIFGGVLLVTNLRSIGKKKEANIVLVLSIVYTVLAIYILNLSNNPRSSLTFLFNSIGAYALTELFYRKYFSSEEYEKKKIWKPLIISIIICIPFGLAMFYA